MSNFITLIVVAYTAWYLGGHPQAMAHVEAFATTVYSAFNAEIAPMVKTQTQGDAL